MSIEQTTRSSAPIGAIVVLVLAVFLYVGMMVNVGEIQNVNTDAMGRGMAEGFAVAFAFAEWVMLAILLLIGGIKGEMPNGAAIAMVFLHPLSCVAVIAAITLLNHGASPLYQLVPGLIAPIIALYAFWARLPSLHRVLRPLQTSGVAWGIVALLTLAPLPQYLAR
jgi:hypothetical protein